MSVHILGNSGNGSQGEESKAEKKRFLQREIHEERARFYREMLRTSKTLYWAHLYHRNSRRELMTFDKMSYLSELYMDMEKDQPFCCIKAVQTGVTEGMIILSHYEAGELGYTVLYVLPKYELRNRFVNNRIYKLHRMIGKYSELLAEAATNVHRTSLMHFGKGTIAFLGSNVLDEFIEIPADSAFVDEKDRCNQENLLLLPDRLAASPYGIMREVGNPTIEGFGIDSRYAESTQGIWVIPCEHCKHKFTPDFFRHVVEIIGENDQFRVRDSEIDPFRKGPDIRVICDKCGKPINRLAEGEWVEAYPGRDWVGRRVSRVFSVNARGEGVWGLKGLVRKFKKVRGNQIETQIFHNSDLGLAFSAAGAKLTLEVLNSCRRMYRWPVLKVERDRTRFAGIDVGSSLHVVIRERVFHAGEPVLRLLFAGAVPGFAQVVKLLEEWRPKRAVVDALPEIHKVAELKADVKFVYSCDFQEEEGEVKVNKNREVRIDRTAILDGVMKNYADETFWNPMQADRIDDGEYYNHLTASTRVLEANYNEPEKSKFAWKHTRPDHYFLAEAYCLVASKLVKDSDVFDFFKSQVLEIEPARARIIVGEAAKRTPEEELQRIERLAGLTPQVALAKIRDAHHKVPAVRPKVDDDAILKEINRQARDRSYVDLAGVASTVGEHEGDVTRILLREGFSEGRIKGQYVK